MCVGGVSALSLLEETATHPMTVGTVLPNLELRVVDDEFRDVPIRSPGELWIRGPTIMKCIVSDSSGMRGVLTDSAGATRTTQR